MSDLITRRVELNEVPELIQRGGDFMPDARALPADNVSFVKWEKKSFRKLETIQAEEDAAQNSPSPSAETDEATHVHADVAAPDHEQERAAAPPPPPPLPAIKDPGPSAADLLVELEKAREDGRAIGYAQGLAAARDELKEAIQLVRTVEAGLLNSAEELLERNTAIIAKHVRRIAQDLAGTLFAEMPQAFVERIRQAADTFTRAGSDFSLMLNDQDALLLHTTLSGDDFFSRIRVVATEDVAQGAFKLVSRDLEYSDAPHMDELPE